MWKTIWESTTKASWTRVLIPDINRWWYQNPKAVSFNMAQILTSHGCFQNYLWSKARIQSPSCVHCIATIDNVEHTVSECSFWESKRVELVRSLVRRPITMDVQDLLCGVTSEDLLLDACQGRKVFEASSCTSKQFTQMVETIMSRKQSLDWE